MFDQLAQEPKINTRMHNSRPRQTGRERRSFQCFSVRLRQQKTEKRKEKGRKEGKKEKRAKRRKESSREPAQQHDPRVHSNTSNVMSFEFRLCPPDRRKPIRSTMVRNELYTRLLITLPQLQQQQQLLLQQQQQLLLRRRQEDTTAHLIRPKVSPRACIFGWPLTRSVV